MKTKLGLSPATSAASRAKHKRWRWLFFILAAWAFYEQRESRNGAGDPWRTDGSLRVVMLQTNTVA